MDKKKKYIIIGISIIVIIALIVGFYIFNNKNSVSPSVNTQRLASNTSSNTNPGEERAKTETKTESEANSNSNSGSNSNSTNDQSSTSSAPKEEDLSSYSSPLKAKAAGRLNNIRITCAALNGTVVSVGETFSFCNTLGPSTAEKGYQEADVIVDGKITQALGGGNCQVSSTLYNAVLDISELDVIERHEHGKDVTYVPDGKDAAVSYGSLDFKFKNTTNNDIKMYFSSDDSNVTVRIVKLT